MLFNKCICKAHKIIIFIISIFTTSCLIACVSEPAWNVSIDWPPDANIANNAELKHLFETFELLPAAPQHAGARSYICVPLFRIFNLVLRQKLRANEEVAVTGDHAVLGMWQPAKALSLKPQNMERTHWFLKKWICASKRIYYRYFTYETDALGRRQVRQWEGQQTARMLQTYEIQRKPGPDIFGAVYGLSIGGGVQRERGWLQHEYVIELKFVWWQHIKLYSSTTRSQQFLLKLETLRKAASAGVNGALIEYSRYAYNQSVFHMQRANGVRYQAGAIVVFRITQPLKVRNAFKLCIANADAGADAQPIGEAYIFAQDIRGSRGILRLQIYSVLNSYQIGELTLPYLVVQPLPGAEQLNLLTSFHHYWPLNWPTMDVGHRGAGASYYHTGTAFVENTIKSFLYVPQVKGDMVELNVQLTSDYVPVLWHGFGFYTAPSEKLVIDRFDVRYVLIKELSYEQLKSARVFVLKGWLLQEYTHLNVCNESNAERIFVTLAEVFESLPKTLGLIIEIKWPQLLENGMMESAQSLNKNRYVNELLLVTTRYGCGRPIIFSSFDADICTMVRLKQNAYPVMLMSTGASTIWQPYMDLRTQSYLDVINFAESADILGAAVHVHNFMANKQLINLSLNLLQAIFIWGNDLRNEQLLQQFRELEVTGLIYDQIDLNGPVHWKRAGFFIADQLLEIFGKQCVAIGNATTVPGFKPPKPTIWPKL